VKRSEAEDALVRLKGGTGRVHDKDAGRPLPTRSGVSWMVPGGRIKTPAQHGGIGKA